MRRPSLIRLARKAERAELWRVADVLWSLRQRQLNAGSGVRRVVWTACAHGNDAATRCLRLLGVTPLHFRNHDKSHRCPGCHAIECDIPKRWYRLYVCRHCDARHWPGLRWQRAADSCDIPDHRAPGGVDAPS